MGPTARSCTALSPPSWNTSGTALAPDKHRRAAVASQASESGAVNPSGSWK